MAANNGLYELLMPATVAKQLAVSERTLKSWRDDGHGPRHVKIGGRIRYRRVDVEQYIDENMRASTQG